MAIAGSGGVGMAIDRLFMRRKTNADTANSWSDVYSELIKDLRNEVQELRAENKELRGDNQEIRVRIRELESEVASLRAREMGQ
ncbi:hypothetical protein [Saccharopolyspora mangrovi]|uniref:Cell division protein ZapB n=1 Tax=Saccharopolyspora mangrovi TaxID=3082379 RepID=A0ABU6A759_9PSEU|nr:hypothetical protein [Saccharopolyspora sp. S2-29]MEB3367402.1 hypothetical protein [Saccharopolyspora sp. S2-29]